MRRYAYNVLSTIAHNRVNSKSSNTLLLIGTTQSALTSRRARFWPAVNRLPKLLVSVCVFSRHSHSLKFPLTLSVNMPGRNHSLRSRSPPSQPRPPGLHMCKCAESTGAGNCQMAVAICLADRAATPGPRTGIATLTTAWTVACGRSMTTGIQSPTSHAIRTAMQGQQ